MLRKDRNLQCEIDYLDDPLERAIPVSNGDGGCRYVGAVKWTRFGEIDTLNLDFENKSQKDCPNISFLMLEIDEEVIHYENYLESFFKDLNNNKNNFFTDVSNYISYELGQPTHCFDLDKLNGRIIFSKEKTNETFETLFKLL